MIVEELAAKLDLHSLRGHDWYIQNYVAAEGTGLYEGLDWLSTAVLR
jgi:hypothetical protein